jgi:hypothetical protein
VPFTPSVSSFVGGWEGEDAGAGGVIVIGAPSSYGASLTMTGCSLGRKSSPGDISMGGDVSTAGRL